MAQFFKDHTILVPAKRKGTPYSLLFNGADEEGNERIRNIHRGRAVQRSDMQSVSATAFLPLWRGLQNVTNPDTIVVGTPFIWTFQGVEYTSSCVAFEKNILLSNALIAHWNGMHGKDKAENLERAKDSVAILHHLLKNGGLEEDQSRPEQELLLPEIVRRAWLVNLERAVSATALVLYAETDAYINTRQDLKASLFFHVSRNIVASTLLTPTWYTERKAMAYACMGDYLLTKSWDQPNSEMCLLACDCLFYAIGICPSGYLYDPPHVLYMKELLRKGILDLKKIYNKPEAIVDSRYRPRKKVSQPPTPVFPTVDLPEWFTSPVDIIKGSNNVIKIA